MGRWIVLVGTVKPTTTSPIKPLSSKQTTFKIETGTNTAANTEIWNKHRGGMRKRQGQGRAWSTRNGMRRHRIPLTTTFAPVTQDSTSTERTEITSRRKPSTWSSWRGTSVLRQSTEVPSMTTNWSLTSQRPLAGSQATRAGTIAAVSLGGGAGLLALIVLIGAVWWWKRRYKRPRPEQRNSLSVVYNEGQHKSGQNTYEALTKDTHDQETYLNLLRNNSLYIKSENTASGYPNPDVTEAGTEDRPYHVLEDITGANKNPYSDVNAGAFNDTDNKPDHPYHTLETVQPDTMII